jgi:hypothetical protein
MHDPIDEHIDVKTLLLFGVVPGAAFILLLWLGFRGCL